MRAAVLSLAGVSGQDLFLNLRDSQLPLSVPEPTRCEKVLVDAGLDHYLGTWTVEATGCHAWECRYAAEITYDNDTCTLAGTLSSRLENLTLSNFQAALLPAETLSSFGWTNAEELDGFTADCDVSRQSGDVTNVTVRGWFDRATNAVVAYRSTGERQEPWLFVRGAPPRAAAPGHEPRARAAEPEPCARFQKELSGPWVVASARGRFGGDVNSMPGFSNCTIDLMEYNMTTGQKFIVSTMREFNVRRLSAETLDAVGLNWVSGKSTIAAFNAEASDGEDWGGKMTGWHDAPSDTYMMFTKYQDGTKDILYWRYGN
jgi:hypothetical protein